MTDTTEILSELQALRTEIADLRNDVREVRDYIRHIQSSDYQNAEDVKQFAINLAANVLVDGMEERQREEIKGKFKTNK